MTESPREKMRRMVDSEWTRSIELLCDYLSFTALLLVGLSIAVGGAVFALYGWQVALLLIPVRFAIGMLVISISFFLISSVISFIRSYSGGVQ